MARILIIEDDEALRTLLLDFVQEEGYEVDAVVSLDEAVARLQAGPFDLVLRDSIALSAEQFYAALDPILASASHPPVVVVSAHDLDAVRVESLGYAALVPKPFDITTLSATLHHFLDRPFVGRES